MDSFKDFLGKDFDDCISQALSYYDCPRESLEVEIVQDAKSGIFGIVGARKAKIRARRAQLRETVASILGKDGDAPKAAAEGGNAAPRDKREAGDARQREQGKKPARERSAGESPDKCPARAAKRHAHAARDERAASQRRETSRLSEAETEMPKAAQPEPGQLTQMPAGDANMLPALARDSPAAPAFDDLDTASWPVKDPAELDQELLERKSLEIVNALVRPLAGRDIAMSMETGRGGPRIRVAWEGDAGLLIGRDGQTLAAVQYLASRMLSHAMGAALRVQLDIGDYRARQDDRLRELAKNLAEKARQTGRPFSTRPLSSYHRRVIHMCLQDETEVQTKSIGDGPQKRVLITPRRPCQP